jgi:hypothetical protein
VLPCRSVFANYALFLVHEEILNCRCQPFNLK